MCTACRILVFIYIYIFRKTANTLNLREFECLIIDSVVQFVQLLGTCTSKVIINVYSFCHFPPVLSSVYALSDHLLPCVKNVFCVIHLSYQNSIPTEQKFVDFFFRISEQTGWTLKHLCLVILGPSGTCLCLVPRLPSVVLCYFRPFQRFCVLESKPPCVLLKHTRTSDLCSHVWQLLGSARSCRITSHCLALCDSIY